MDEDRQERLGCLIMLVLLIGTMAFFWWRSDKETDHAIKKLDYCIENNIPNDTCREIWNTIKVGD